MPLPVKPTVEQEVFTEGIDSIATRVGELSFVLDKLVEMMPKALTEAPADLIAALAQMQRLIWTHSDSTGLLNTVQRLQEQVYTFVCLHHKETYKDATAEGRKVPPVIIPSSTKPSAP